MTDDTGPQLIGYSLSFCVGDILRGDVCEKEVTRIITQTCAVTVESFEMLLEFYALSYWTENPDEGKAIARRLYTEGKIDQPRLRGEDLMRVSNGHWRLVEAGEVVRLEKEPDGFVVDPDATSPGTVREMRERKTSAAVKSLQEGTAAPLSVRSLRLKAPAP